MPLELVRTSASAAVPSRTNLIRLRTFVTSFSVQIEEAGDEEEILRRGGELLKALVGVDDWLPERYAQDDPGSYRQYLLYTDAQERFSIISFVWGPGQVTPIHDHTVWGLIGMLRGSEVEQRYKPTEGGMLVAAGPEHRLMPGEVAAISPSHGDLHRVSNVSDEGVSISIHVYGANMGTLQRSAYDVSGSRRAFVSGYSNHDLPNIWE
jgi:predicted metal-dependent enzyme (double-stranded beta helix superfamily)